MGAQLPKRGQIPYEAQGGVVTNVGPPREKVAKTKMFKTNLKQTKRVRSGTNRCQRKVVWSCVLVVVVFAVVDVVFFAGNAFRIESRRRVKTGIANGKKGSANLFLISC